MVEILSEDNEAEFFASEKALKAVLFSNTIASMPACSSHICDHASMFFCLVPSPCVSWNSENENCELFASSGVAS